MDASLRDLNVKASELARRAERGDVIVITDRGRPIADLGPHRAGFRFARKDDVIAALRASGPIDAERFRADLDAVAHPDLHDPYVR